MSKYRIMDVPDFSPGKCGNCGASKNDGRKYVDFCAPIDWYGTMYLCGTCVHDIAENMGQFDEMREALATAERELQEAKDKYHRRTELYVALANTIDEIKEINDNIHTTGSSGSTDGSDSLGNEETTPQPSVNQPEPRATKSTPSSRSKNVPSLASLLENSRD